MPRKGYQTKIATSPSLRDVVRELDAYHALMPDLLQRIESAASDTMVTRAELLRDYGFTASALRMLEKTKQLVPERQPGRRAMYDLRKALKFRAVQPAIVDARYVRTTRKHANITTVNREYWARMTD